MFKQLCGYCATKFWNRIIVSSNCMTIYLSSSEIISTECVDGKYGPDCGSTCGKCKNSAACDKGNGRCPDCITGYNAPYCKGNVHSRYNYFGTKFTEMVAFFRRKYKQLGIIEIFLICEEQK